MYQYLIDCITDYREIGDLESTDRKTDEEDGEPQSDGQTDTGDSPTDQVCVGQLLGHTKQGSKTRRSIVLLIPMHVHV